MVPKTSLLPDKYSAALKEYLTRAGEDEHGLLAAYALGRQALAEGLGVLDVVALHHQTMSDLLRQTPREQEIIPILRAGHFLTEALSSYELTYRGFREATATVQHVITFAAALSHELRTPLTSILASAGMLQELRQTDTDSHEGKLLANILEATKILKKCTDDLTDIAGFLSGTVRLSPVPFHPSPFLKKVCQRLEPVVKRAGISFKAQIPDDLPVINADPGRLEQVLANLVDNAVEYGSSGPSIDVRAGVSGRRLVIEVQDYGKGIAREDQNLLFLPSFRARRDGRRARGLGLGLTICKQIIEAMSGDISIQSEEGKGTLVRLTLPLKPRRRDNERVKR